MDSAVIINNLVNNLEEPCGQCCYHQQLGLRAGTNQEGCQGNGKCRTHAYQQSVSASKASNTLSQMARIKSPVLSIFLFQEKEASL